MANATTVGALTLTPTFECIGVVISYTGDDNTNNTALLEYQTGAGAWKTGPAMYVDRTAKQYRGSIFWLAESTLYNVRVTFSDADGITGTNPVTGSTTTRDSTPPSTAGSVYTVDAASGSATDIQSAATTVYNAGGGIVNIPAGTFNLGGSVTVQTNVALIGAGIGVTVLNTTGTSQVINVQGNSIRLSGFSLVSGPDNGGNGINVSSAVNFRIDHCRVQGYGAEACIAVSGTTSKGVIDHCYIKAIPGKTTTNYGVVVRKGGWWPNEGIDDRDNFVPVQADAVYIEDNEFHSCRHCVASTHGSYYVFRYNTIYDGNSNTSSRIDVHGYTGTSSNGGRYYEIYGNTINTPSPYGGSFCINPRGGDGVIFNNTMTGYTDAVIVTLEEGQSNSYPQTHQCHRVYVWGNTGYTGVEVKTGTWVPSGNAIQEGRDWFHYAKPGYSAYTYPHPLQSVVSYPAYYVAKTGNNNNPGTEASPWLTIQKAVTTLTAGQTCYIKAGTYTEDITFANSGISTNYIYFKNFGVDAVTINGGLTLSNISYVRLNGFTINDTNTGIYLHRNTHDIIIENCTITIGGTNNDSCIFLRGEPGESPATFPTNILVQDNTLQIATTLQYDDNAHADKDGVYWFYMHGGLVCRRNVVKWSGTAATYGPYDAFGGGPENSVGYLSDCDFYDNTIMDCHDDGIQPDGDNINVRVWGNTVSNSFSGISFCPCGKGPLYVFRNVFYDLNYRTEQGDNEGYKVGDGTTGRAYIYHNTTYVTNAGTDAIQVTNGGWSNVVSRNNVYYATWYIIEAGHTGDVGPPLHNFNYDYLWTTDADRGIKWGDATYSKANLNNWRTAFSQELNGIISGADPLFTNTATGNFNLQVGSPLIDAGVVLPFFNDSDSPWPYSGAAPDIGATEYQSAGNIVYAVIPMTVIATAGITAIRIRNAATNMAMAITQTAITSVIRNAASIMASVATMMATATRLWTMQSSMSVVAVMDIAANVMPPTIWGMQTTMSLETLMSVLGEVTSPTPYHRQRRRYRTRKKGWRIRE